MEKQSQNLTRLNTDAPADSLSGQKTATKVQDNTLLGIGWMLLTIFLFVSMDTVAKSLTQSYPVEMVIWARYFFHFGLLVLLVNLRLPQLLRTGRLTMQVGRSAFLVITTALFFFGISQIPLASASSIMLASPLLVTTLSVPFLGEKVGIRRWASVCVGFIGAVMIIRPGADVFQLASLLPLGAAIFYAFYQISTRALAFSDSPMTTLIYTAMVGAILTTLVVPFYWKTPDLLDLGLMFLLGFLGAISQFCLIKSFAAAPASTVTPFTYSNMIWATLFGYIVFDDLPDLWTVAGALILIASGLYIFHREHLKKSC